MVENRKFLNRLRNGHLEKSAVTGICSPSCSPKTAKTPRKVHLRLRFQNLGKPRTAGLCGRAAGACDCGPLSCTKIERVNRGAKLSKSGCGQEGKLTLRDSFLHCRNRIRKALLHIAHKRCNVCFKGAWRVHTPPHQQDRTQWPTRASRGCLRRSCTGADSAIENGRSFFVGYCSVKSVNMTAFQRV